MAIAGCDEVVLQVLCEGGALPLSYASNNNSMKFAIEIEV